MDKKLDIHISIPIDWIKDTGTYEMGQMVYLGFRVVLDGKKS